MEIRKFKVSDASKVSYLIRKCIKEIFPKFYSKKEIQILCSRNTSSHILNRSKDRTFYVAVKGNRILGVMGIKNNSIRTSYVNPRYQGKGIGKKLIKAIEEQVKKEGQTKLTVLSSLAAKFFYESCGFSLIKQTKVNHNGLIIDEYYMEKEL